MTFRIYRVSDRDAKPCKDGEIKIESLEDLIQLQNEVKNEFIVDVEKGKIVIYDGYIE